jgi:hypothetical protein
MTVDRTTWCNAVYGLFCGKAEENNNEGETSSANNPNECKEIHSAIAEGKYEHTDDNTGVPLATEPGISLIFLPLMRILQ